MAKTLSEIADCSGLLKVFFFGELSFGRVGEPDVIDDEILRVASLSSSSCP